MKAGVLRKVGRCVLWLSPVVIVVGGFFASIPWLKQQNDTSVRALSIAAAIFVIGYAVFIGYRVEQRLDEVEIASQRFAIRYGWTWGSLACALLLMLPSVKNWVVDLANMLSTGSPAMTDRGAVKLALFFGFMLVVLIQLVAVIVASAIWQRRMRGRQERS